MRLTLEWPAGTLDIHLRLVGAHNAHNATAAATAALAAGISPAAIQRGLEDFAPVSGRGVIRQSNGGATVIDDTYNANPDSVRAAIDLLASLKGSSILVLGDMGEVGEQGPEFHAEIGAYAREQGLTALLGPGRTHPRLSHRLQCRRSRRGHALRGAGGIDGTGAPTRHARHDPAGQGLSLSRRWSAWYRRSAKSNSRLAVRYRVTRLIAEQARRLKAELRTHRQGNPSRALASLLIMHQHSKTPDIEHLEFTSRFVTELPADPETRNFPRQVTGALLFARHPDARGSPRLVAHSAEMLDELGLSRTSIEHPSFAEVLGGNRVLPGVTPHATCYGGHQFGHWAGQLGDGRAINLGEVRSASGQWLTLQLKGAGRTPYSRTADGLAVLRSSIREFLCSEAMHHLGVPTTRALSLVTTGEQVSRDMFYDGNPRLEPGAIVCRVAPSFTRFGHFEIHTARGDSICCAGWWSSPSATTSRRSRPRLQPTPHWNGSPRSVGAPPTLIVHWQRVGFVHGVMNTDNLSILGLTIDYGPYGWIDDYNPDWTPNTTDAAGAGAIASATNRASPTGIWCNWPMPCIR
jgi:hypothetical protein